MKPPNEILRRSCSKAPLPPPMASGSMGWNLLIAGWSCTLLGTTLVFTLPEPMGLLVGSPLLVAGFPLLMIAFSVGRSDMARSADPNWAPSTETLPDAGRVMFRVDTTLDTPIRTSILCGACGNLEWVNGGKPGRFTCPSCSRELWKQEEE